MILGHLLVRPVGICPREVRHEVKIGKQMSVVGVYSYQWATQVQESEPPFRGEREKGFDETKLPRYDGSRQRLLVRQMSYPTEEQLTRLEDHIAAECNPITDSFVTSEVVGTALGYPMICTTGEFITTGIQPNILRTCRDLWKEGLDALYSKNLFHFDYRLHGWGGEGFDGLQSYSGPETGELTTMEMDNLIDEIFDPSRGGISHVVPGPFLDFIRRIGLENTKLIHKIQVNGGTLLPDGEEWQHTILDLIDMLPISIPLMARVCPNLTGLAIHKIDRGGQYPDETLDRIIEKVVQDLPGLRLLQLGSGYAKTELKSIQTLDWMWGSAHRWEKVVYYTWCQKRRSQEDEIAEDELSGDEIVEDGNGNEI